MASQSETGHAKNLAAFQQIITCCKAYLNTYNPGNANLTTDKLTQQYNNALTILDDCKEKQLLNASAIDIRIKTFSTLRLYATRIMNAMLAAGADKLTLDTAKTINRKIQGQRASQPATPTDPNQPQPNTASTSQQSYDNLVEHFKALVKLVTLLPEYQPNETDLKLTGLNAHIETLKTVNFDVLQTDTDWSTTRLNRDNTFYDAPNSLGNTMNAVKAYVKSVFGANSKEFKQISGIRFVKR
jgi:hypothetical protein